MRQALFFLAIATLGTVTYHLGQKTISPNANPMLLLMGVYAVAFVLSAFAAPFFQSAPGVSWHVHVFSWPVLALGVGVVLIELGFLLAYRSGNMLQWSGVAVNAASTVLLVPIALVAFGESFSSSRVVGVLVTLAGLALMTRR
jgi:drug/metabolite transporter (DMT)-like permease